MPAYSDNLRQELEMMQSKAGQDKLERLYKSLFEITEMSDQECDSLEAEFRKNNIFK